MGGLVRYDGYRHAGIRCRQRHRARPAGRLRAQPACLAGRQPADRHQCGRPDPVRSGGQQLSCLSGRCRRSFRPQGLRACRRSRRRRLDRHRGWAEPPRPAQRGDPPDRYRAGRCRAQFQRAAGSQRRPVAGQQRRPARPPRRHRCVRAAHAVGHDWRPPCWPTRPGRSCRTARAACGWAACRPVRRTATPMAAGTACRASAVTRTAPATRPCAVSCKTAPARCGSPPTAVACSSTRPAISAYARSTTTRRCRRRCPATRCAPCCRTARETSGRRPTWVSPATIRRRAPPSRCCPRRWNRTPCPTPTCTASSSTRGDGSGWGWAPATST